MFGFGKKANKAQTLHAYALESAANIMLADLRTLQRAVELIFSDKAVADIMSKYVNDHAVADALQGRDIDVGGKTYRLSAAEATRTEALNALHQWFCKELADILPENAEPNAVGLLASRLLGMPFVEDTCTEA